jgi:hypothetical protein
MSVEAFEETMKLTMDGCAQIYDILKATTKERVLELHQASMTRD